MSNSNILTGPVLLLCLCGFRWDWLAGKPSWEEVDAVIVADYPEVSHISAERLQALMAFGQPLLIVDVRTREEYAVSHIPGAVQAEAVDLQQLPKEITVIAYCSVGLRSAAYVDQLRPKGQSRVFNLRGSIFAWANSGYPLVSSAGSTVFVHPYNSRWGTLLKPELHQYDISDSKEPK